jgi:hypothetical protein
MSTRSYLTNALREVNKAIGDLVTGAQSATINTPSGSRSYTRPQLPELRSWRKELMAELSMSNIRKRVHPDFS